MTFAPVWAEMVRHWYPNDPFQPTGAARQYYETKWRTAARLGPSSILEIGVRAGYSALAFARAVGREKRYLGIDSGLCDAESGNAYLEHARMTFAALQMNARVWVTQAQSLRAWPNPPDGTPLWDLIHVDADHGYDGCLHDLLLSAAIGRWILVDDYDTGEDIRRACDALLAQQPNRWAIERIPDGGLAGNMLFTRCG